MREQNESTYVLVLVGIKDDIGDHGLSRRLLRGNLQFEVKVEVISKIYQGTRF